MGHSRNRQKSSQRNSSSSGEPLVVGVRAVLEVLRHRPERAAELLVSGASKEGEIEKRARSKGVPLKVVDDLELESISSGANHQGVILRLKSREYTAIKQIIKQHEGDSSSLIVAVDELYDPQNFGSILRASECFGADAVVWSKNRGVAVTPTVSKVSAGASELVTLCPVSNLRTGLNELKNAGYWICVTAVGESASSVYQCDFPEKCVIVLGSEGKGVQPLIQKEADILLEIPMMGHIDSLNVSQAAAVLLSAYRAKCA